MKMLLRVCSALIALVLLGGVIYLGMLSAQNSRYIVWFGIASAIAAPVGLSLLSYALQQSNSDIIQRLAKVPEIERLVAEASTYEEKVRVLEDERARLVEIIKLESRRLATRDRIESLERDGMRIIRELDGLSEDLRLIDEATGDSIAHQEIERLRKRVEARSQGDVAFRLGTRIYRVDRDIIKALPFGFGNAALASFRILESFQQLLKRRNEAS